MKSKKLAELKNEINSKLSSKRYENLSEMRSAVKELQLLIAKYEQAHYGQLTEEVTKEIREYRLGVRKMVNKHKELFDSNNEATDALKDDEGVETLRRIHGQINLAAENQQILQKGTLKLTNLNLTNEEIKSILYKKIRCVL